MTDRPTASQITDDALDALYAERDQLAARVRTLEHVAKANKRHVQMIAPDLERAEAALARVQEAVHVADADDVTDWQRGYRACSERALTALDGATQPTV